jgi:hypothetical protein
MYPCYYMPGGRALLFTLRLHATVGRFPRRVLFKAVSTLLLFALCCAFCAGGAEAAGATGAVASKRLCSSGVINNM